MPIDFDRDDRAILLKQAMKEWLDEKWRQSAANFGQWVLRLLGAALFLGAVRLAVRANGWGDQ